MYDNQYFELFPLDKSSKNTYHFSENYVSKGHSTAFYKGGILRSNHAL